MCSKNSTISRKRQYTLTYLLVRFECYAQRTEKSRSIIHRKKSHTLWWSVSHFVIHSSYKVQKFVGTVSSIFSTEYSLLDHRKYSCLDVSKHAWHRPHRDYSFAQTQRSVSVSCRYSCIPESDNVTTILTTHFARWSSKTPLGAFSTVDIDVGETSSTKENHSRHGFHRVGAVWKTGTCNCRIQSNQTRTTVLSSITLLRWYYQRLHHGRTSLRQHVYINWNDSSSRSLVCKNSTNNKTRFYPCRQRVFRSRDYREDRRTSWVHVYHCSKTHQPNQEKTLVAAISQPNTRNRNSRILLSTSQVEKEIPIYCYTTTTTGRPNRTTLAVFFQQIQLPGYGDEHGTEADKHLAFLQRSCWGGAYYQRTQERLSVSQNSDKTFCSERIVFSYPVIFVQSCELVQTVMFAPRISNNDAQFVTRKTFTDSGRTCAFRQSACT